jgi:hypothetical protein
MIDKSIEPSYGIQSVWKITEIALMCVNPRRMERPSISEVLKEIEEAIMIEQKASTGRVESIDILARKSRRHSYAPMFDISFSSASSENTDSFMKPGLR